MQRCCLTHSRAQETPAARIGDRRATSAQADNRRASRPISGRQPHLREETPSPGFPPPNSMRAFGRGVAQRLRREAEPVPAAAGDGMLPSSISADVPVEQRRRGGGADPRGGVDRPPLPYAPR
eukprot:gene12041-biopygen8124